MVIDVLFHALYSHYGPIFIESYSGQTKGKWRLPIIPAAVTRPVVVVVILTVMLSNSLLQDIVKKREVNKVNAVSQPENAEKLPQTNQTLIKSSK